MLNRRQRGEGQFGCLVGLIVLLIGLFICFKMVPVKIRASEIRQTMEDEAKSAGTHNDERIRNAIIRKGSEERITLSEENIKIERTSNNEIIIDIQYDVPVDFPGYLYTWHFHHHATNPIF
jgi:hypothetical protein